MESPWDVSDREPNVTGHVPTRKRLDKEVWEGVRPVVLHSLQGIIIIFMFVFTDLVYAMYVMIGGWIVNKLSKLISEGESSDHIRHIIHTASYIVASLIFVSFFLRDIWRWGRK
jgi:hypothetical protein